MCGIVGYTGSRDAQPVLIDSLSRLEYRGYDSCGIAVCSPGSSADGSLKIKIYKDAVRVKGLEGTLPQLSGNTGIGHTRWATHGAPCRINAHPHSDCTGKIAVVHNGVISNYMQLRKQMAQEGHEFVSDTDTEVIPHLIEKYYYSQAAQGDYLALVGRGGSRLETAVKRALQDIEGSYAIIVIAEGEPGMVVARKDSPLILGAGDRENFVASDVPAILEYTNRVIYLEDGDVGIITPGSIRISHNGREIIRPEQKILWTPEEAQKGGYEHFMLKEIFEQPRIIRDTLAEYLSGSKPTSVFTSLLSTTRTVLYLACGTSYNAALIGKYVAERLIDISVKPEIASEFNYRENIHYPPLSIGITQSGETADTLKAMRLSKENKSTVVAITNVVGSTASKLADYTLYTRAGPEISVAATKSFIAQLVALYWLALSGANLEYQVKNDLNLKFRQLPDKVQQVLSIKNTIASAAVSLSHYENIFFIGRSINYPVAMEGALKLKEVSYIHAEAYAAGEIKHGPFALLTKETPVVAIVANDSSHDAMLTSIKEIKARGSPVIAIVEDDDETVADMVDFLIPVPATNYLFSPFVNTVAVQLLAYYTARERNCPIDFPRNLAKSVTVE